MKVIAEEFILTNKIYWKWFQLSNFGSSVLKSHTQWKGRFVTKCNWKSKVSTKTSRLWALISYWLFTHIKLGLAVWFLNRKPWEDIQVCNIKNNRSQVFSNVCYWKSTNLTCYPFVFYFAHGTILYRLLVYMRENNVKYLA